MCPIPNVRHSPGSDLQKHANVSLGHAKRDHFQCISILFVYICSYLFPIQPGKIHLARVAGSGFRCFRLCLWSPCMFFSFCGGGGGSGGAGGQSLPFSSSSSSASDSRYHALPGSDFRWLKAPFAAGALQWYSAIRDYLGQQLVILGSSLPVPASFKIFGKLVQNSTVFQPQRSYSPTG